MKNTNINFNGLTIAVADDNFFMRRIIHGMLRGFGAKKIMEVDNGNELFRLFSNQKVDLLICDASLPPHGGSKTTQSIRRNTSNENRTLPILLMASSTSEATVKNGRDAGANIVVAKPLSPSSLYDRLSWIAFNPRPFVDTATYFGPDRRFKIEGYPGGVGRRRSDAVSAVAAEEGPALGQDDIDNLFSNAVKGQG